MNLEDFGFHLPESLIAQEPLLDRAASRMLVVNRTTGAFEDRMFQDFPSYLAPGDCLVLNDSRVLPSRLFGRRHGIRALPVGKRNPARHEHLTRRVEVFLLEPLAPDYQSWRALVRPGKKLRIGERIAIEGGPELEITGWGEFGERSVRFLDTPDPLAVLESAGHMPLPPYIKRPDRPQDRDRYQTVFARSPGSVAAPTAGLHFDASILARCRERGADIAYVTLHVGLGTFQPLRSEVVEDVKLHAERWSLSEEAAGKIQYGERIVAVGTTAVRTLETMAPTGWSASSGETSIFLYPGYQFLAVDAMLTNFHLPQSSLFLLVCAFAGADLARRAYEHAIAQRYRFYSYGDCMLIL